MFLDRSFQKLPASEKRAFLSFGEKIAIARVLVLTLVSVTLVFVGALTAFASDEGPAVSGEEGLKRLVEGNGRFVADKVTGLNGDQLGQRRMELANGQKPFAVIVSCSDSRVPPELVFDQSLGDVFVVRTAAQIVDNVALGSIEYAVEHLGSELIVVMGHEKCGGVAAAVAGGKGEQGHIPDLVKAVAPVVQQAKAQPGDPVDNTVRAQAIAVAKQLQTSAPILSKKVQANQLTIVPAYYHLDTGKVEVLKQ